MQIETDQSTLGTDLKLERRIFASLQDLNVPSLRNVKVRALNGTVLLRGQVNSFYAKQLSQHSARRLAGENQVVDEVSVAMPATFRDPLRLRQVAAAGVALVLIAWVTGSPKFEPRHAAVQPAGGDVAR